MPDRIATCPWCLYVTDAITDVLGDDTPDEGDCSLCIQCGMPSMIDDDAIGGLRKPTRREHEWLGADPMVLAAMATWFKMKGQTPPEDDE